MQSPIGRKLVAMSETIYDVDKIQKTIETAPGNALTQKDMADAVNYGFIGKLSDRELADMAAFGRRPAGSKMTRLTPKVQQIVADNVNGFVQELMAPAQTAVLKAMRDFIAKAK
jgi:phage terminase large subunit-like protein